MVGMDEEMEVFMFTTEEPTVAEESGFDFDYEFDAPHYYDFTLTETPAEAREAELWFDSATSYPPSPFVVKLRWKYDFHSDIASVSCNSRRGSMSSIGNVSDFETDHEAFAISQNHGELCSDMDQDVSEFKTKSLVKPSTWKSSTLMKPTASYLAKHNQIQEFHFNQILRSQKIVKSDKGSQNSSTTENHTTKRQKLEAGFLRKVSHLKHQTHFLHKVPVKVGLHDVNSLPARSKVTIPREPNLETAHRAQRHRVKIDAESGENAKSNACNFKAHHLNRKILEAPSSHPPKKNPLQPTEFQVFQLRTSERARQHARNNVATLHNYNSQRETKDSKSLNSADALKEEKCEEVQKIKTNSLNKKISSSKGELGIFRNIRKETAASMDYNVTTDKSFLNEPPIDLFSKLSLASHIHTLKSQTKMPSVSKDLKENAPESFLFEHEMKLIIKEKSQKFGRNQYQCGSELSDRRITEGGSRFNINRNLDIR